MSAQDIMEQLGKMDRPALIEIDARLHQLLEAQPTKSSETWGEALLEVAGMAKGLPSDLAHNHDHYLHGTARR